MRAIHLFTIVLSLVLVNTSARPSDAQEETEKAIVEILSVFGGHDVVLIGEQHWMNADYDFRTALVRHPRFPDVVNDIVIESGNALFQPILDEYVLKLKDVPDDDLRKVWRDTLVTTGVWDSPIYEQFIRTVRAVNESLPENRRIRLLAGDPPIDWSKVQSGREYRRFLCRRNSSPVEILKNEVLGRGRKALVIYGGLHLTRTNSQVPDQPKRNVTGLLDREIPENAYVIMPLSGKNEYTDNFVRLAGGERFPVFVDVKRANMASLRGDAFFYFATNTLGETVDGILFLGAEQDIPVEPNSSKDLDGGFQKEQQRRENIANSFVPGREFPVDR